ncbi:hypothetical protein BDV12DRAFT_108882 [Aspergillus spectabilis]
MSFYRLPAEIVLLILDCIDTIPILKNFCLTSRKCRAVAQPLLYREIILAAKDLPLSVLLLCRTVTTCPLIAAQIRLLDIDTEKSGFTVTAAEVKRRGLSVADLRLLKIEAQNLKLNSGESFDSRFWATDSIILPVLLISRCQNLRELFITLDPAGLSLLTGLAQARTEDNSSQLLSCLGSVEILHLGCFQDCHGGGIEISNITLLLSLLHLSKIQISDYASNELHPWKEIDAVESPLGSLSIATISLCLCSIRAAEVGELVKSCKELASFYCGQSDSQPEQLNPYELYSQLFCQRSSLRVLQLSFQDDPMVVSASPIFTASECGSLREFGSLEYLTIDQLYLGNAPELPSSLTYLSVQNCQTPIAEVLAYLAQVALTGHFPSLKRVSLHTSRFYPGGMLDLPRIGATDVLFNAACQKLRRSFKETKIKLYLESDLLDVTSQGYADAFEFGHPGGFWPFIYVQ